MAMKRSTFLKTLVDAPAAIGAASQSEPRLTAQEVADRFSINACTLGDLERIVEGRYYSGRGLIPPNRGLLSINGESHWVEINEEWQ